MGESPGEVVGEVVAETVGEVVVRHFAVRADFGVAADAQGTQSVRSVGECFGDATGRRSRQIGLYEHDVGNARRIDSGTQAGTRFARSGPSFEGSRG